MFPVANGALLLLYLTLQRLMELAVARRNTRRLLARGAYEVDASAYPIMVAFHAAWLVSLWALGWNRELIPAFVLLVGLLQAGRFWIMATLGERWTTRIIVTPWAPPLTTGPYRFVRHPNYLIVALELPCVSLALGLWWHALVFGALNLAMLRRRVRSEDAAFARPADAGRPLL